ncbi:hypothetical protein [Quadrisphaera sp. INWT6]|uniref:hypothetical protein n=1 Tax=Quadrisphaera sp. INWT6 TaxID=2596917 RepID=UPI0018925A42|nr:hypothetical protein [Quadrisphaera sp. INWT6]MBF5083134.1 hypothetical protein [Quadrisphaera sp. INWT6]
MSPAPEARTWAEALDALEVDTAEVERLLLVIEADPDVVPDPSATWTAPAEPLPAELAPRAAALLTRHQQAVERVTAAMTAIRRQQRRSTQLASRLDQRPEGRPVYVDRAV